MTVFVRQLGGKRTGIGLLNPLTRAQSGLNTFSGRPKWGTLGRVQDRPSAERLNDEE
jgi:hypothetical protein